MDKLFEIAQYYKDNLTNRTFDIIVEKKRKSMTISLRFSPMNFKHLLGLHKLNDIPFVSTKSESLYKAILNKQFSFDDIIKIYSYILKYHSLDLEYCCNNFYKLDTYKYDNDSLSTIKEKIKSFL